MSDSGQDGGLLGDLPSHRPSVRSPRRKAAAAPTPGAGERRQPPGGPSKAPEPAGDDPLSRAAGLAAAPARLGLRLAGRTIGGIGKAMGRR